MISIWSRALVIQLENHSLSIWNDNYWDLGVNKNMLNQISTEATTPEWLYPAQTQPKEHHSH